MRSSILLLFCFPVFIYSLLFYLFALYLFLLSSMLFIILFCSSICLPSSFYFFVFLCVWVVSRFFAALIFALFFVCYICARNIPQIGHALFIGVFTFFRPPKPLRGWSLRLFRMVPNVSREILKNEKFSSCVQSKRIRFSVISLRFKAFSCFW